MSATFEGADGKARCKWCEAAPELLSYHDTEWGFPVSDDFRLFEKLSLEGFQSGLSWRTILLKRENFRAGFLNFDFNKIAQFTDRDVQRLLTDEGIIRHRGKIEAVIHNAQLTTELVQQEGSLGAFIWRFEASGNQLVSPQSATTSAESVALSKELKKRGWKFIGPTTAYAFLQSLGLINDHAANCVIRADVDCALETFNRPGR